MGTFNELLLMLRNWLALKMRTLYKLRNREPPDQFALPVRDKPHVRQKLNSLGPFTFTSIDVWNFELFICLWITNLPLLFI